MVAVAASAAWEADRILVLLVRGLHHQNNKQTVALMRYVVPQEPAQRTNPQSPISFSMPYCTFVRYRRYCQELFDCLRKGCAVCSGESVNVPCVATLRREDKPRITDQVLRGGSIYWSCHDHHLRLGNDISVEQVGFYVFAERARAVRVIECGNFFCRCHLTGFFKGFR